MAMKQRFIPMTSFDGKEKHNIRLNGVAIP
jgi:hypothetical protein